MIKGMLNKVVRKENLSISEARLLMGQVMEGGATPAQIGGLLTALRMKGETVDEIVGSAQAMREKAHPLKCKHSTLVDTCGTGGDGSGTFNISTTVAFVAAGAGLPVAKHGNRSVSSKSGSADLLEALGVKIDLSPCEVEKVLNETGIAFLYAPIFHQAMKYAIGPRREVGIRSIFNLLGPLTNPAHVKVQVLGVYDPDLTETVARVLEGLGAETAYVVHGAGGLDEISTIGATQISCLQHGKIRTFSINPEDYGFKRVKLRDLQGGEANVNAQITRNILKGEKGAYRDIVLLNGAAVFVVSGLAADIGEGIKIARETIDSGRALEKLEQLIEATKRIKERGDEACF
jgi:anthranilate phosphoribosyltransferase